MARDHDTSGVAPRRAALRLLRGVVEDRRLVPELIAAGVLDKLPPEDRARAQRLALDTLRFIPRADRMLAPYLKKPPPLAVRQILRLGTVELALGAASHGVVNAMVTLAGEGKRTVPLKGMVNAVLRRVAEAGPDAWNALPTPKLPGWLRGPLTDGWGRAAVQGMEAAHAAGAALDLTAKHDPQAVAEMTGGTLLPTGSVRLRDAGQVTALPGYKDGAWWVQDAAAALPVQLLGDVNGLRALDLCAAPGGKTLQLAACGAEVTAVDDSETRMQRVTENLNRTGLKADCIVRDAFKMVGEWDVILLDAPCSATGTIRRHPDLPWAKDGSEFAALIDQQSRLIDHALSLLAPAGRLVFCTCSVLPDEGEVQIDEALERHPGLTVVTQTPTGADEAWRSQEGGLRLRPDHWAELGGMDGFYMAVLHR